MCAAPVNHGQPSPTDASDDSLASELAFLETLLCQRPAITPIVLSRLGELGEEGRRALPVLLAERRVKLERLAAARRSQGATRAAAVACLVAASPMLGLTPASAAQLPALSTSIAAPSVVTEVELRVMDRATGKPLSGVRLQTAAEELVAVTDVNGRAMVPVKFKDEPVLTLERSGYPLVLIEGSQLASRSMITMKPFSGGATWSQASSAWPDPSQLAVTHGGEAVRPKSAPKPVTESLAMGIDGGAPTLPHALSAMPAPHEAHANVPVVPVKPTQMASDELVPPVVPQASSKAVEIPPLADAHVTITAPKAPAEHPVHVVPNVKPLVVTPDDAAITRALVDATLPGAMVHGTAPTLPIPHMRANVDPVAHSTVVLKNARATTQLASVSGAAGLPYHPPTDPVPGPRNGSMAYATIVLPKAPRPARQAAIARMSGSFKNPKLAMAPHEAPAAPSHHTESYTVRHGDMLCSIAARELGDSGRWAEIYEANRDRLTNLRQMQVGLVLNIPHGIVPTNGHEYVVKSGDSLSRIAHEQLGDARRWRELYHANRGVVRDPSLIFPGQHLTLPGASAVASAGHPAIAWATVRATESRPG